MTTQIEAAPQPSNFTASFNIKIDAIRVTNIGDLTNVIKKVEWTMNGTEEGQTFSLPQVTDLGDPDPENFVQFAELTEENVVAWIESTETRLPSIKAHIQMVLDKEVQKAALETKPLPWAPVVETPQAPEA